MAKTFSELQALALQIRDEILEKKNTAPRVGAALLDMIDNTIQNITDINQKLSVFEYACSGFKRVESESQLPVTPPEDEKAIGYLVGKDLYLYVEEDGNAVDGRYFNVGDITGPQGEIGPQGIKGDKGDKGEQGNSGVSGSTDNIEVVNNLDGGESTPERIKVLAAEQGKVLNEKFSAIGENIYSISYNKNGYYLNGIFYSDDNWKSTVLVCLTGILEIEVKGKTNNNNVAVMFFDKDQKYISTLDYGIINKDSFPENALFVATSSQVTAEQFIFKINRMAEGLFVGTLLDVTNKINEIETKQAQDAGEIQANKSSIEAGQQTIEGIISDVLNVTHVDTNLYNPDDLLTGWYIKSNTEFVENKNGIMGGKIVLENGEKYASQGIQIGEGAASYLYGANFDSNDNFLGRFLGSKVSDEEPSNFIFTFTAPENYAYSRIMFQNSNPAQTIVPFSKDYSMLEKSDKINPFVPYGGRDSYTIKEEAMPKEPEKEKRNLYIEGASFAYSENGWFELACEKMNFLPLNKAVSGSSILDFANKIHNGTAWTEEEFESFDILAIMHVHNYNVADEAAISESYTLPFDTVGKTPANYAQAYDYVLKEYAKACYACKDNSESKWYGQKMGKPFKVVCCTHWHDARVTFNTAIRALRDKWGFELCEFDKHVGFTKNQVNPATNEQWSIIYCNNGYADTEVIDDVTYGWHQTRGKDAYIQQMMAQIFVDALQPIL